MPVVQEFAKELEKHRTPCAHWHKVDLHNHSPASHDFQGNRATAEDDLAREIAKKGLSVVMFTDHEVLPDAQFVANLSKRTSALILAGLEINVFVDAFGKPADKVGKEVCFHLLLGFDPEGASSPAYWVEHLYRSCRTETRDFGGMKVKGIVSTIDQVCDLLKQSGALIIPAHLHSGKDAFRTRSVDLIYSDTEFLRWVERYFTALDVRQDGTAKFFDGRHPETSNLERSCIRSSDAHRAEDLGTFPTWVQMERVSFAELKAALELPSRVCRDAIPPVPSSYIIGMHIEGQFIRDFWMTLSPHMNVLIGVKGSGKTSILECLRFGLGSEVPGERKEEVAKHLNAILGPAGQVRLLAMRDDGARVLIERRVTDRRFRFWFEDDRVVEVNEPESMRFPAAVLGWHEIEHAATERQIRRLHMDAIAGREDVKSLTEVATIDALAIRHKHDIASAKYNEYLQLSATVSKQEAMREGLQQLNEANLVELRNQMSNALADREVVERLKKHLAALPETLRTKVAAVMQLDQFEFGDQPPLAESNGRVADEIAELDALATGFRDQAIRLSGEKLAAVNAHAELAEAQFQRFATDYGERLRKLPPEVQRLLESHREVLEKTRDLPTLKARLEQLREEVGEALRVLSETSEAVAATLDKRLELRRKKVEEFNVRLEEAGVRLAVIAGTAQEDEFQPMFSQFGQARDIFQQLRTSHAGAARFHRTLAAAYKDLREDLTSGDRVMFSRADFGHYLSVLENDDLAITFAVGKPGEAFSPIDQLSAGQRCTAVFPIILKLRDGPLVVDQPEDNLDNRHIARSVAPVLVADKRIRQIVLTSHNANLVVLSDPECIAMFEAANGQGNLPVAGFLSNRESSITSHVLDILDGGDRALELRSRKYGRLSQ